MQSNAKALTGKSVHFLYKFFKTFNNFKGLLEFLKSDYFES